MCYGVADVTDMATWVHLGMRNGVILLPDLKQFGVFILPNVMLLQLNEACYLHPPTLSNEFHWK